VASLLMTDRETQQLTGASGEEIAKQLDALTAELQPLAGKR